MDIRPIRNDDDHRDALKEIERLWIYPDDSPENDKLDVLTSLVEAYEAQRWPMRPVSPAEILVYAIDEMGRSQRDLASILKSRSMASELLRGKRQVSLDAARKISAAWNIPIQLLVAQSEQKAGVSPAEGLPVIRRFAVAYEEKPV